MKITLTVGAVADITSIGGYIGADNPARASSFVGEIEHKISLLTAMPHAFPLVPGYEHAGIRRRPFQNYIIFYRVIKNNISVLRVLNSAMDWTLQLDETP